MKQLGIILSLFAVVGTSVYLFTDQLLLFIMTGLVPFTQIVISPFGMILFWAFIVPVSVIAWKLTRLFFWKMVEVIGYFHQKQINRHVREFIPRLSPSQTCLITNSLLILHTQDAPEKTSSSLRSRLAPIPS